jgi:hypothetical protein
MRVDWTPLAMGLVLVICGGLLILGRKIVFTFVTTQERNNFGALGAWLAKQGNARGLIRVGIGWAGMGCFLILLSVLQ